MDRLGRPIYTNARWQEIHGLDIDTTLIEGNTSVVHPADATWVEADAARLLADEEDVDIEYRVRRPTRASASSISAHTRSPDRPGR